MANETKVGLTAFTVLLGVFGYVLYGKYEHKLVELAGGPAAESPADDSADPLAGDGAALGDATTTADTGDLAAASDDGFGDEPTSLADFGDEPRADPMFGDEPVGETFLAADDPGPSEPDAAEPVDFGDASAWGDYADESDPAAATVAATDAAPFDDAGADDGFFTDGADEVVPVDSAGVTVAAADPSAEFDDGTAEEADGFWGDDDAALAAADPAPTETNAEAAWGLPDATADAAADFAAAAEDFAAEPAADVTLAADDFGAAAEQFGAAAGETLVDAEDAFGDLAAAAAGELDDLNDSAGAMFGEAESAFGEAEETALAAADAATEAAEEALPVFFGDEPTEPAEPVLAAADPVEMPAADPEPAFSWGEDEPAEVAAAEPADFPLPDPTADPTGHADAGDAWGLADADEPPAAPPTAQTPADSGFGFGGPPAMESADAALAAAPPAGFGAAPAFGTPEPADPAPPATAPPLAAPPAFAAADPAPERQPAATRDDAVRPAAASVPARFTWSSPDDKKVATVLPGETYWAISKRCYGDVKFFKALARYNARRIPDPRKLAPGMKIVCPTPAVLRPYDQELVAAAERAANPAPKTSDGFGFDERGRPVFVVGPNDTLGGIAQNTLGKASRWKQIHALNLDKIPDPRRLRPGTLLNLPADASGLRRRSATR